MVNENLKDLKDAFLYINWKKIPEIWFKKKSYIKLEAKLDWNNIFL